MKDEKENSVSAPVQPGPRPKCAKCGGNKFYLRYSTPTETFKIVCGCGTQVAAWDAESNGSLEDLIAKFLFPVAAPSVQPDIRRIQEIASDLAQELLDETRTRHNVEHGCWPGLAHIADKIEKAIKLATTQGTPEGAKTCEFCDATEMLTVIGPKRYACGTHLFTRPAEGGGREMMKTGIERIAAERKRQTEVEGWTPEHDDQHVDGALTAAAICYAAPFSILRVYETGATGHEPVQEYRDPWPWGGDWDKRKTHPRMRQLEIAGALIAAEIDRLARRGTE